MSKPKITKAMRRALEGKAAGGSGTFRWTTLHALIGAGLMRWGDEGIEITDAGYAAIGMKNHRTEYPCGHMQGRGTA